VEDLILSNDRLDEFQSPDVYTIYWDEKGPGRVREIAFVAPEVTKRDKEKNGTGDNCRLEEYITVTSNL